MLRSGSVIPHLGVDPIHVLHGWVRNVVVATTTTKECRGCGNDDKRSARGGAAGGCGGVAGDRRRAVGGCGRAGGHGAAPELRLPWLLEQVSKTRAVLLTTRPR